jgi:hypothetical protein
VVATPTKYAPILARGRWGKDMLLAVRFNSDPLWQFSEQFALKKNEFVLFSFSIVKNFNQVNVCFEFPGLG